MLLEMEIIIIGLLYGANKHSQSKADIKLDSLIVRSIMILKVTKNRSS